MVRGKGYPASTGVDQAFASWGCAEESGRILMEDTLDSEPRWEQEEKGTYLTVTKTVSLL